MVNVSPREMLAAGRVVKLVAKKTVLPVEKKMHRHSADGEDPNPAAQRRMILFSCELGGRSDYCTFLAGAASPVLIIVAVFV